MVKTKDLRAGDKIRMALGEEDNVGVVTVEAIEFLSGGRHKMRIRYDDGRTFEAFGADGDEAKP